MSKWIAAAVFASLMMAVGCGGGGSSNNGGTGGGGGGAAANTIPMVVAAGPTNNAVDTAYVSVTVCAPGSSNCTTVPNIAVDTGSMGLRILKSALNPLSLPQENGPTGNPLVECAQFVSFFTWGPVVTADVKMAGEVASSAPIQVIDESQFPLNSTCSKTAPQNGDTVQVLQANGILGVGVFQQDCGNACAPGTTTNQNFYYECPATTGCNPTTVALNQQVPNPVIMFANDNNGTILQLPAVAADGAPSVSGTLVFGIGTQSNNGLGSATVLPLDPNTGTFTTLFASQAYSGSFIDSGSNGIFFLTPTSPGVQGTGIVDCTNPNPPPATTGFYCPPNTVNLSATNQAADGSASNTVNFSVANANALPATNFAFNDLAGDNAGPPPSFDWGLAFFFGRNVYTSIQGATAPGGVTPYFAY